MGLYEEVARKIYDSNPFGKNGLPRYHKDFEPIPWENLCKHTKDEYMIRADSVLDCCYNYSYYKINPDGTKKYLKCTAPLRK